MVLSTTPLRERSHSSSTTTSPRRCRRSIARELLELFLLGIGNYTEADIQEGARSFTGWQYRRQTGVFAIADHPVVRELAAGFAGDPLPDCKAGALAN
jgi:uncharacterized protein (DUF1800 family)